MLNIRRQKSNVCELPKENYVESRLQALVQPKSTRRGDPWPFVQHLVYTQAGCPRGSGADVFIYKEGGVRNLSWKYDQS